MYEIPPIPPFLLHEHPPGGDVGGDGADAARRMSWRFVTGCGRTGSLGAEEPFAIGLRLSAVAARELLDGRTSGRVQGLAGGDEHVCFHDQRLSLRQFPRHAGEGAGVQAGLDRAGAGWITPKIFSKSSRSSPGPARAHRSRPCPDPTRPSPRMKRRSARISSSWRPGWRNCAGETGHDFHLGLEPEPLGHFENTAETLAFFDRLHADGSRPGHHPPQDRRELRRLPFRAGIRRRSANRWTR